VPPADPSGLTATAASATRVDLAWTDNSGNETGFKIERSLNGGAFAQVATVGANVTTYADTGVSGGNTYTYRVRASNAYGDSGYTATAAATTPLPPPAAPTSLTTRVISKNQINLAWRDNANNETGYYVERSLNGTSWTRIATLGANTTSYASTGLTANTLYYYRVQAYNTAGVSAYSNTASARTKR
jgi:titin